MGIGVKWKNRKNKTSGTDAAEEALEFISLEEETIEEYKDNSETEAAEAYDEEDIDTEAEVYDEEDIDADIEAYDEEDIEADTGAYDEEDIEADAEAYDEEDDDADYEEDEDIEYLDEDEEDDGEEAVGVLKKAFENIVRFIGNMSTTDRIAAALGLCIIIAAAVTGTIYASAGQAVTVADIGGGTENISVVGESGLLAIADADITGLARMLSERQEEAKEEEERNKLVEVGMNVTSIQSDIKIKFVNKETNKLIANVPFEAEVTGKSGKSFAVKDEDEDGIIYQTGVDADTYTVKAKALKGGDYEKYHFDELSETIKVTDTIAYKKVDVADEIKSESEINAAAEDTAQQTVTESTLTDTVEWVESTRTEIDSEESYQEINKSDIPDPSASGRAAGFIKLAGIDEAVTQAAEEESGENNGESGGEGSSGAEDGENGGDSEKEGGEATEKKSDKEKLAALKPTLTPTSVNIKKGESVSLNFSTQENGSYILDWSSSDSSVAVVDENGVVTGAGVGSASVTATIKLEASSSESVSLSCSVTVAEDTSSNPTVTYKIKSVSGGGNIKIGQTCTVSAVTEPEGGKVTWSSSNDKIASVDANGLVTGVSVGTVSIIGVTESGDSRECKVTVEEAEVTYKSVKITGSSSVEVGKSVALKAVTEPTGGSVAWTSDNEKVAKVDNSGNVTGVSAGSATITASCGSVKGTIKITVTKGKDASSDTKSRLKDKNGKQVYIKNSDGKYVEATYADYYKSSKFYLKSTNVKYRYTGWQTIDGYTYFFDKNGNYVTGEQVIQGAKYVFGSDGRLSSSSGTMGIDVSKWNGSIDWNAVRNSGVSYAIIRCGYRGSSTGALIEDPRFAANIKGAKAAGLKVGVYFFSQAVNEVEAVEEASMVINLVKGYGLNYPVFLDVEASGGRGDSINAAARTAVCKAFCATIQNSGYSAGIYANKTWLTSYINTSSLTSYKIWLAQYAASPTYTATRYDMWQYSSKGKVSGISGNVDMNISYMNY